MTSDFDSRYTQYQLDRSPLRKVVRQVYLKRATSLVRGPTLDFGCGIGELLQRLPPGSRGLEYNKATVEYCRQQGLDVDAYDGFADDWSLSALPAGSSFQSMVISHVLEHLEQPIEIFKKLLRAVTRTGVTRVLVIVPGQAGFRIDSTHLTFVDRSMLADPSIETDSEFRLVHSGYFPGNLQSIGNWFPHHELQALYVRETGA